MAVLIAPTVILCGCRAQASVLIEVKGDGSSEVTIGFFADREASELSRKITGKPLLSVLDFEPLTSTGWSLLANTSGTGRPSWASESAVLHRSVDDPRDLSATLGSITLGNAPILDRFVLEVKDLPHATRYLLHGTVRLPPMDELIPPFPSALSETLTEPIRAKTATAEPKTEPLEVEIAIRMPGRIVASEGLIESEAHALSWRIGAGQAQTVSVSSEVAKGRRLLLWSASLVFSVMALAFCLAYIAARRRRPSTSFSK